MKKTIFILIIGIFLINFISAISIDVEIDMLDSFSVGEELSFSYTLISDENVQVNYISHILCPNAPINFLEEKTIQLQANQPYINIYSDQIVQDWFEPQICKAYVQILSPLEKIVSDYFSIETNPSFDFNVLFCKDQLCTEKTKVFIQGENIYLDYESSVENALTTATLIYPDKSVEQISLPTLIKVEQIGTYELEVTATKEGYKIITKKEMFGVIESEANSPFVNMSGEGDLEDTNLTKDVGGDVIFEKEKDLRKVFYWIGGFVFLILIGLAILFVVNKRKNRYHFQE